MVSEEATPSLSLTETLALCPELGLKSSTGTLSKLRLIISK
jgi:hypothetical protein